MEISVSLILSIFGIILSTVVGAVVYLYKSQEKDKVDLRSELSHCQEQHNLTTAELRQVVKECGILAGKVEVLEKFQNPAILTDNIVRAIKEILDAK